MIRQNPIYKREQTVRARSARLPAVIFACNLLLSLVALLNMYQAIAQVKSSGQIQYSRFLQLYGFAAAAEFLLLLSIMPAMTAGSISGERERQTLSLLFTTMLKPSDIVLGKLLAALDQLMVLLFSSLPVIFVTFVYGSIRLPELLLLFLLFFLTAVLTGGIGLCFSALCKRTTRAAVCTFGVILLLVVGTVMCSSFFYRLSLLELQGITSEAGQTLPAASAGGSVWLLLLNPAVTFLEMLGHQVETDTSFFSLNLMLGDRSAGFIASHWILLSMLCQAILAACFLALAVYFLKPRRGRKKKI